MVYQKFNKTKQKFLIAQNFELGKFISLDNTEDLFKTYLRYNRLVASHQLINLSNQCG